MSSEKTSKTGCELESNDTFDEETDFDAKEQTAFAKISRPQLSRSFEPDESVTHLAFNEEIWKLAITRESQICEIFDINTELTPVTKIPMPDSPIVGTKFSQTDPNYFFAVNENGNFQVFDLRVERSVLSLTNDAPHAIKNYSCFDISHDGKTICVGTERNARDSFLLFWDIRNAEYLGGYWELNKSDITQVRFHPKQYNSLASASADGIINIYDLTKTTEEEAWSISLNAGCSVYRMIWYEYDKICCVTDNTDAQFWTSSDCSYTSSTRAELCAAAERANPNFCYVPDCYSISDDEVPMLIIGSYCRANFTIRSLSYSHEDGLKPFFELSTNYQFVNATAFCEKNELIFTGGDSGTVDMWNLKMESAPTDHAVEHAAKAPPKTFVKDAKLKPYENKK